MKQIIFLLISLSFVFGGDLNSDIKKARDFYEKGEFKQAKKYYSRACNKGIMLGCSGLGTLYERGLDVEQDLKKAKQYYDFACKRGDSFGCFHARLFEIGPKAEEYYEVMCDNLDATSCFRLADLYYKGLGVPKNFQDAAFYYQKACSLYDASACFNLGVLYEIGGDKVKQSAEIALAYFFLAKNYFEKECYQGNKNSCKILNLIKSFYE
ncbi:tetratricopeptide repeat protein [Helicobacter anatolicus]|uniref:tetratricopeptide repeat protein n=1 Tax=Helicobacter anatolicus TaxID=2905874 RepID=UPI001E562F88|nr:tetratricopeptide repeat protein [Helicobacter anatolicus]MCE3038882.1 sel1 repeat family protein [Helicobacter anatolicus]